MAHHVLKATTQTVSWGYWDASAQVALTIDSGDSVTMETLSGEHDDLPFGDARFSMLPDHLEVVHGKSGGPGPHLLTGTVYVRDAQPGDILQVHVKEIRLRQDWGWNVQIPLMGTLPEEFDAFRRIYTHIDIERGTLELPWGQKFTCKPFFGCMGVAPPREHGRLSSVEPRAFGGNIDNKELGAGAIIQYPVFAPGALFSAGDGHALQGDGEVCLTAIETALTGTFGFTLVKGQAPLTRPRALTETAVITMAFDEDLDNAARSALREMIALLTQITDLSREDAYTFCSIASDLRITQTVNRHKGVHCVVLKENLPDAGKGLQRLFPHSGD